MADELNTLVQDMMDIADDISLNEVQKQVLEKSQKLKISAQKFLEDTATIRAKIEEQNQLGRRRAELEKMLKNDTATPIEVQQVVDKYKASYLTDEEFQIFIKVFLQFHKDLNEFLEQEVKVIYVFQNGSNNPILYEMEETGDTMIKSYESQSGNYQFKYKYNVSQKYLSSQKKIDQENLKFNIDGLRKAYKESRWRGNYSQQKLGLSQKMLLLYKPQDVWEKIFIINNGDINEAYASFVLRNKDRPSFKNNNIEKLIKDFIEFSPSGVMHVDNVSGLLSGDYSKDNIEYSIKSAGASGLKYPQVLEMANIIASMGLEDITEKWVQNKKKELKKEGKTRNKKVVDEIENFVEEEFVEGMLKDLNKRLKSYSIKS